MIAFTDWRTHHSQQIENWLSFALPEPTPANTQTQLWSAMRYTLLGGGKRFRALLVYAGGALTQARMESLNFLAGAVEALHAYSLVHDDLPCMDDDDLRRGKPTCHKVFGEAMALLAGDALHALAFDWVLSRHHALPSATTVALARHFSQAIGYQGMVGGQAIDIASTLHPQTHAIEALQAMHECKTGALIAASLYLGYLAGIADDRVNQPLPSWLRQYARDLGLLFQVVDDYLDATEESATLGKTAGKDARDGKLTYISLLGLEATREKISTLIENLRYGINNAPLVADHQKLLIELSLWVAKRDR